MNIPFAVQLETLPSDSAFRREAAQRYRDKGLPTRRNENWKYTDLGLLGSRDLTPSGKPFAMPAPLLPEAAQFVFANGVFSHAVNEAVLPKGVTQIASAQDTALDPAIKSRDDDSIFDLNTALFSDGFVLTVPPGTQLETPIEICFTGNTGAAHARLVIKLDEDAKATIIERHLGGDGHTATLVTEIDLAPGARLHHMRLVDNAADAVILATGAVTIGRDATYNAFSLTTGGKLSRHQVIATLVANGGTAHLNGAHVLDGDNHADTTTEIVHAAPHCSSRETYRHVMDGTSRSVFQGKIFVAEGAQKTDGFQLNQSLMLSPNAEVDAKPELEIYADDVKCSHGATSGRLDEEALFYLRSRGIPLAEARSLLIEAFIGSALDLIENEAIRDAFKAHAAQRLIDKGTV